MPSPMFRRTYVHNELIAAAQAMLKQSMESKQTSNSMGCIVFCALAIEAALNHVGSASTSGWHTLLKRRLSAEAKLSLLATKANREIDFSQRPFRSFRTLFQIRNLLAHGSTQDIAYETANQWIDYGDKRWPATKWEVLCNTESASVLYQDMTAIVVELFSMAGVERVPTFLLSEHISRQP